MDLLPLSCFQQIRHLFLADQEQRFPGACFQGSGAVLKGSLNPLQIQGWQMPSTVRAVVSIVYLTCSWPVLQKMGFTTGQDWLGRAWAFLIDRGNGQDWPPSTGGSGRSGVWCLLWRHSWHSTANISPSNGWTALAICTLPSFPVTYLKAHQSRNKMQGSHPSILCVCLPLRSFKLGDRRCLCGPSHAQIYIQNVMG